jgi:UDP-N-acetylglucosamine 2-epimerase (non-hydrolysing)/GDP/UDP-N,N'-diacetylbacillosamine 2-epimerase (hydrolysing)
LQESAHRVYLRLHVVILLVGAEIFGMRIAVLTTGRQDWGSLRGICLALAADPGFELLLFVGGMHLSNRFGRTERMVAEDGFAAAERLDFVTDNMPDDVTGQAGRATVLVGEALGRQRPDALLLLGDRFETAAAALAATLVRIPVVHVHGGEETGGAFDDAIRHAITKLSHLHLVSHPDHARRVVALGENPAVVHVVGAPALDNLHRSDLASRAELEDLLKLPLTPPVVVVTLHPATLGADPRAEVEEVVAAMDSVPATYIITLPNTDPGGEIIRARLVAAAEYPRRRAVEALGDRRYWGLLHIAAAMLGNSSSALIEAPVLGLPAVNVGTRQEGRLRGKNVVDAGPGQVPAALRWALDTKFRAEVRHGPSPYGDGRAAAAIVKVLRGWHPPSPPVKAPVRMS